MSDLFTGLGATVRLGIGSAASVALPPAVLFHGRRRTEDEEDHAFVQALVCAIAGTIRLAMATGVAAVTFDTGRTHDPGRILEPSVATPLLRRDGLANLGRAETVGAIAFLGAAARRIHALVAVHGLKRIVDAEREGRVRDPDPQLRPRPAATAQ